MPKFKTQSEMFDWIRQNREWKSEISGKPLVEKGHMMYHWQFAHVLSKGAYPKYRLNPENIILMLPEEHDIQETFLEFRERKEKLKQKYYSENQIKKL